MKISAMEFSRAGDKYLGRSYEEMDCQAFVEKCMADCGYRRDLGGSNSWYRECVKCGWTGTPEECVKEFGAVPKGALLFIREEVSASTPGKFRGDGIGDITHMGIKTGRGDGAIHSSRSEGKVAESRFKDKTVPNGGWNRVGLLEDFEYGEVEGGTSGGIARAPRTQASHAPRTRWTALQFHVRETGKTVPLFHRVTAPDGKTVNLRKGPEISAALVDRVQVGTVVEELGRNEDGSWIRVRAGKRTGWMMAEFLVSSSSGETYSVTISGLDLTQARAIAGNYPGNSTIEKEAG